MYEKLFSRQEGVFKVIANQKRLEIIQLLTHGEMPVNDMVNMLGISQSNVSQHLGLLRQAGLVKTRRDGKAVYYHLSDDRIAEACSLIRQFLIDGKELPESAVLEEAPESLYPLVRDRVCGMRMGISEASEQTDYQGRTYYFCAAGCKHKFIKRPDIYRDSKLSAKEQE